MVLLWIVKSSKLITANGANLTQLIALEAISFGSQITNLLAPLNPVWLLLSTGIGWGSGRAANERRVRPESPPLGGSKRLGLFSSSPEGRWWIAAVSVATLHTMEALPVDLRRSGGLFPQQSEGQHFVSVTSVIQQCPMDSSSGEDPVLLEPLPVLPASGLKFSVENILDPNKFTGRMPAAGNPAHPTLASAMHPHAPHWLLPHPLDRSVDSVNEEDSLYDRSDLESGRFRHRHTPHLHLICILKQSPLETLKTLKAISRSTWNRPYVKIEN